MPMLMAQPEYPPHHGLQNPGAHPQPKLEYQFHDPHEYGRYPQEFPETHVYP